MSALKKLQTEIDKCLKKVQEGIELFDNIWEKVQSAGTPSLKDKYEAELKREIKKLQRYRDQIKTWAASSEVRNKQALLQARKDIEAEMERFKVLEKESKTKAYSKEGLSKAAKKDPKQDPRYDTFQWLDAIIGTLKDQLEELEEKQNKLRGQKLKGKLQEELDELNTRVERHNFHLEKLELSRERLEDEQVTVDQFADIKESLEYYLESGGDPDYVHDEAIYDLLDLDAEPIPRERKAGADGEDEGEDGDESGGDMSDDGSNEDAGSEVEDDDEEDERPAPPVKAAPARVVAPEAKKVAPPPAAAAATKPNPAPSPPAPAAAAAVSKPPSSSPPISSTASTASAAASIAVPSAAAAAAKKPLASPPVISSSTTSSSSSTMARAASAPTSSSLATLPPAALPTASPLPVSTTMTVGAPVKSSSPPLKPTRPPTTSAAAAAPPTAVVQPPAAPAAAAAPVAPVSTTATPAGTMAASAILNAGRTVAAPSTSAVTAGPLAAGKVAATNPPVVSILTKPKADENAAPIAVTVAPSAAAAGIAPAATALKGPASAPLPTATGAAAAAAGSTGRSLRDQVAPSLASGASSSATVMSGVLRPTQPTATTTATAATEDPVVAPAIGRLLKESADEYAAPLRLLDASLRFAPAPADSDRPRPYLPRNFYRTPSYFPSTPSASYEDPALFEKLPVDTLFFIFYFQQGTVQQYLAARELKKQSWRYHKNFLTWFRRHDDPKLTTDEFEQGSYVYFDYDSSWTQRVKSDFTFDYRHLEDELTMPTSTS